METKTVIHELESLGKETYKRVLVNNHEVREPCFGVPISELKKITKRIRKDYRLALDLYETGNYDAMYLAMLITEDESMTQKDLQRWVKKAYNSGIASFIVAPVAAASPHALMLARKWIASTQPIIACAGWSAYSLCLATRADTDLDLREIESYLETIRQDLHSAPDRVRYQMNNFVICAAAYVLPLHKKAKEMAQALGKVTAHLGNNACQIPYAPDYIQKIEARGAIGKKRKSTKC